MSETLVQVSMQIIADVSILPNHVNRVLVNGKFLKESIAFGSLVVGIGEITDGYALASVLCPYPVGVRQIDANGS